MIAVITDPAIGGTFLTWTIYYLSNRTQYFSVRNQCTIDLPDNPLTGKNAHNFIVNQPNNIQEFNDFLPRLINKDECLYLHQLRDHTQEAITELVKHTTKNIIVALTRDQLLYLRTYIPRTNAQPAWTSDKLISDPDEIYKDFVNYFFKESSNHWQESDLNKVWDKREFIALNFDPYDHISIKEYVNSDTSFYYINPMDLWTNFDNSVLQLFDYLKIDLDHNRYQKWLLIYKQWQNTHKSRLMFVWYFNIIIENILIGNDFDLNRFNLDLVQEATIQHELIYKHNLNFKTWQLDKFCNTKQLHDLLEPNIHDLSKSLIKRLTQ